MKRRLLLIALVVSLGINVGGFAVFGYHKWVIRPHKHGGYHTALADLKLSAEQDKKIKAIRAGTEAEVKPLFTRLMAKRLELIQLLKADTVETARRDALLAEIAALQTEIEIRFLDSLVETKQVLTPVQRETFVAALEKGMQEKRRPFEGPHPPHK